MDLTHATSISLLLYKLDPTCDDTSSAQVVDVDDELPIFFIVVLLLGSK